MAMYAPAALGRFYNTVHKGIPQTKNGGAVGDARHIRGGGYHISPRLLKANGMGGDYSLASSRDRTSKTDDRVSAQDITFTSASAFRNANKAFMKLCEAGKLKGSALREWFGSLDSRTVTGYSPYRDRRVTSSDPSHLWHIHFSIFRDSNEADDLLQLIAELYVGSFTPAPVVKPVPSKDPVDAEGQIYTFHYPDDLVVYTSRLREGVIDSDSVLRMQMALNKFDLPGHTDNKLVLTGDMDKPTILEVKKFQRFACGDPEDGELGPIQTRYLMACAGYKRVKVMDKP